jgi:hypothetical protein
VSVLYAQDPIGVLPLEAPAWAVPAKEDEFAKGHLMSHGDMPLQDQVKPWTHVKRATRQARHTSHCPFSPHVTLSFLATHHTGPLFLSVSLPL